MWTGNKCYSEISDFSIITTHVGINYFFSKKYIEVDVFFKSISAWNLKKQKGIGIVKGGKDFFYTHRAYIVGENAW